MTPILTLTDTPDPAAEQAAGAALYDHNVAQTGIADRRPIAVVASDPATGAIAGGLWGRTELGVLFLDMFFLPEPLRGHELGARMLTEVEAEARRRGCRHAVVETSSFQAPGFYSHHGYQEFGRIAFTAPGQARVFLRKSFEESGHVTAGAERPGDAVAAARRSYAEELRFAAHLRTNTVVEAFATVPRERFVGPGPWRIRSPMNMAEYWTTDDADPRHVYHDVLVALDETRGLNNGQPSLWASLLDELNLSPGERVLHLGCGTGYYSAILAELVGTGGTVAAVEIDAGLAEQARTALTPWPQARVIQADGSIHEPDSVDAIVASAGATHPLPVWLDSLEPGGRLLFPLTADDRWGAMLLITRQSDGLATRFIRPVGFFAFAGARDPELSPRLASAFARGDGRTVKSLRHDAHEEDETCWLHGKSWCLSRRTLGETP